MKICQNKSLFSNRGARARRAGPGSAFVIVRRNDVKIAAEPIHIQPITLRVSVWFGTNEQSYHVVHCVIGTSRHHQFLFYRVSTSTHLSCIFL